MLICDWSLCFPSVAVGCMTGVVFAAVIPTASRLGTQPNPDIFYKMRPFKFHYIVLL